MADKQKPQDPSQEFWYRGKVTRRRLLGYGAASAGALGASMLVPAPWQAAFGQAKPYKMARCNRSPAPRPLAVRRHSSACRWRPTA